MAWPFYSAPPVVKNSWHKIERGFSVLLAIVCTHKDGKVLFFQVSFESFLFMDRPATRSKESAVSKPWACRFPLCCCSRRPRDWRGTGRHRGMETWLGSVGTLREEIQNSAGEGVVTQQERHREVDLASEEGRGIPSSPLPRQSGLQFFFNAIQCIFIEHLLCSSCRIKQNRQNRDFCSCRFYVLVQRQRQ